jgi:beta-mannosidase
MPMFASARRNQLIEIARQAARMERHVRAHPSNIMVSYINEPRPAAASQPHRFMLRP